MFTKGGGLMSEITGEVYEIPEKQAKVLAKLRNPCSAKKILEYGQICGCGVYHGGREGTYLVGPDNSRLPLSRHPGDATPGQRNAARKFIERVVQQLITGQGRPALAV